MSCASPIECYYTRDGKVIFTKKGADINRAPIVVPCGQCLQCRIDKTRDWAQRIMHESKMHKKNAFVTLTFNNENLPSTKSINKKELQLWIKNLRKKYGKGVRYYAVGEYGEKDKRPHYHACLFNIDVSDKTYHTDSIGNPYNPRKNKLHTSKKLESTWKKGFVSVGELTYDSAAYVAGYVQKKITGKQAKKKYGEKTPPFSLMSRMPGIGKTYYEKYKKDIFSVDGVVVNNVLSKPASYYDYLLKKEDPQKLKEIKNVRLSNINPENLSRQRLVDKEQYQIHKNQQKRKTL